MLGSLVYDCMVVSIRAYILRSIHTKTVVLRGENVEKSQEDRHPFVLPRNTERLEVRSCRRVIYCNLLLEKLRTKGQQNA